MDTRKLYFQKGGEPHEQAQVYDEATGATVAITYSDTGGAFAAELVKRWNEYPALLDALKASPGIATHKPDGTPMGWGGVCTDMNCGCKASKQVAYVRDLIAKAEQG